MADDTPNLTLPYLAASQAQKHVTVNESLRRLDAIVMLSLKDRDLAAPPASPSDGDRYLVAASPTGAWAGKAGAIAAFQDGAWAFLVARPGWIAFIEDEGAAIVRGASDWLALSGGGGGGGGAITELHNLTRLGVGASADAANPFSAKLNKALWTAKPAAEGGAGDLRYTLNKETSADVLSLLFQSGWSGRAELGFVGADDFTLRVSATGASWTTALSVNRATGVASFPAGLSGVTAAQITDFAEAVDDRVAALLTAGGNITLTYNDTANTLTIAAAGGSGGGAIGKQTVWVPATAMIPRVTAGPADGWAETGVNKVQVRSLDFDAATTEFAQFQIAMPKSWDEGAVSFQALWSHGAASTTFGVVWQMAAVALSDGDGLDAAFGTAASVTDTGGAADTLYQSPTSGPLTIAGAPSEGDLAVFQISRAASDAADTLSVDADLIGVRLFFTTNTATDD